MFGRSLGGIFFTAGVLVAVCGVTPAQAQSIAEPKTWTATPFLETSARVSGGSDNSLGLGVAAGYDFTSNVGVEGELAHLFDVAATTRLSTGR